MLVYFSGSARDVKRNIEMYRLIVGSIQEAGGVTVNNWLEVANMRGGTSFDFDVTRWREICGEAQTGLSDANLHIAEVTGSSTFGVGYEVALALSMNKPVLALLRAGSLRSSYITGIQHPQLKVEEYDSEDVTQKVKEFVIRGGH